MSHEAIPPSLKLKLPAMLLSLRIGDQEFAIDIMSVREIRGWMPSTPLPQSPSYVRGMINLRGVVMAIMDLGERLGLPSTMPDASSVVVVVELKDRVVGLVVDAVSDILTVTADMVQAVPDVGRRGSNELVEGVMTIDGRIVSILALGDILPEPMSLMAA